MRLIWKLLRKHISIFELGVFFIANLIGIVVILSGTQLYADLKPLLTGEKSLIGNEYMIVTKPVQRVGINSTNFTREEISDIEQQPFTLSIGEFCSSQYEVYGSLMFQGRKLTTMMFFESVPDKFIDVESDEWHFTSGQRNIPIIIPRNYLNLYNFGFSQTQDLPQITENLIRGVELTIELSGNFRHETFTGYIVGFSDRLNTILVPESFMLWANERFAPSAEQETSRLIIEVKNPSDPAVIAYLEQNGFVAEDKPAESNKALFLLKVCVAIIVGIGVLFSLLSIIIFTLSIYLLLQKNIDKLENLVLIGYTPSQVARPYNMMALVLNLSIFIIGVVAVGFVQQSYMGVLSNMVGYELPTSLTATIITGIVLTAIVLLFNVYIIRRKVVQISRKR